MGLSDQVVYIGNKRRERTVWGLRRGADGRTYGLVRVAGRVAVVYLSDECGYWKFDRWQG